MLASGGGDSIGGEAWTVRYSTFALHYEGGRGSSTSDPFFQTRLPFEDMEVAGESLHHGEKHISTDLSSSEVTSSEVTESGDTTLLFFLRFCGAFQARRRVMYD